MLTSKKDNFLYLLRIDLSNKIASSKPKVFYILFYSTIWVDKCLKEWNSNFYFLNDVPFTVWFKYCNLNV